jgi:hypothetical protein
MLPKNVDTPRGQYLKAIADKAAAADLAGWPMLNEADYVLVGGLVVLCSYIDLNLRRVLEAVHHAGILGEPWASKLNRLDASEVSKAILSLSCWDDAGRKVLAEVEEIRGLRNLVSHFAIRRFPAENAFIFIAKSARDFRRQFGYDPPPGAVLTAIVDCEQIRGVLKHVQRVQNWLAVATKDLEEKLSPGKTFVAAPRPSGEAA